VSKLAKVKRAATKAERFAPWFWWLGVGLFGLMMATSAITGRTLFSLGCFGASVIYLWKAERKRAKFEHCAPEDIIRKDW
jgi:hypothetical protein